MIRSLWNRLVAAILDAQKAIGPAEEPSAIVPALASRDLVNTLVDVEAYDAATIASRPVRSTKADAKRAARQYAEQRVGHALSWKSARRLLNQWEREERGVSA